MKGEARADVLWLEEVREAFQESMLTFRVDIVDWHAATASFRELLAKDLHLIQAGDDACL